MTMSFKAPSNTADMLTDADVVRRVLGGDVERFAVLVRRYQTALGAYARSLGIPADPADDLVQDALIRGYERLSECQNPERFGVWVFRILRNLCLDHLKNIRRRQEPLEDLALASPDRDPMALAEAAELRTQVTAALRGMNVDLRDAFVMKHVEGRSYEEMSEIAEVSVSALKMRVHRAREALRAALETAAVESVQ